MEITTKTLRGAAVTALMKRGYEVESFTGRGRPAGTFLKLTKDGKTFICTVRSTRDRWIAFHRRDDGGWDTLDKADFVAVAAVNDRQNPTKMEVYLLEQASVMKAFDAAFDARTQAGHIIKENTPWVGLDAPKSQSITAIGSGLADHALWLEVINPAGEAAHEEMAAEPELSQEEKPLTLTIAEAKKALATTYGVPPEAIEITIRG